MEKLHSKDVNDSFTADSCSIILDRTCCAEHKKMTRRARIVQFRFNEMLYLCSKTYCCSYFVGSRFKVSSPGPNKLTFEDNGDGPMAKYRKTLVKTENKVSTNRGL